MPLHDGYAYPLLVALPGSTRRHYAKQAFIVGVVTLCGRRGTPTGDGDGLPICAACAKKPNPIRQQTRT